MPTICCTRCQLRFTIPKNRVGTTVECPDCRKRLSVKSGGTSDYRDDHTAADPSPVPISVPVVIPREVHSRSPMPTAEHLVPCPYCAEMILAVARKCKHCGEMLDPELRKSSPAVHVETHVASADRGSTSDRDGFAFVGRAFAGACIGLAVWFFLFVFCAGGLTR